MYLHPVGLFFHTTYLSLLVRVLHVVTIRQEHVTSDADDRLTEAVKKAVERLGIRLLGHVSVAGENYYGNADEEKL